MKIGVRKISVAVLATLPVNVESPSCYVLAEPCLVPIADTIGVCTVQSTTRYSPPQIMRAGNFIANCSPSSSQTVFAVYRFTIAVAKGSGDHHDLVSFSAYRATARDTIKFLG